MEDYIGEVRIFANTYPPRGWLYCEGQILNRRQFEALFSIIGFTYGGDGGMMFALPDLRSKVAIGAGPSHGLGATGGKSDYTITSDNIPAHQHPLNGTSDTPTIADPTNAFFATPPGSRTGKKTYANPPATDGSLDAASVGPSGNDKPESVLNIQPYLDLAYAICLEGEMPHRP
jgi:microcystin-dependent protein